MKKFVYSALILGSAVALASCSADEPGAAKGDANVTLTVQLPADAATRYGEGTSVTTLYYTVYAAGAAVGEDGTLPESLASGSVVWPAGQTQAQVELTLVPGDLYDVVFFADNRAAEESGTYTYDAATADFSIDYSKIASNSDDYDAFFTKYPKLSTATTEVIPLSRPFAQLNIGTNDWDLGVVKNHLANGGTYSSTLTFEAKGLASGVNFFSGDYTDATTAPEINITKIALGDGYPVNGCKYLEMNYLLVDPAKDAPTLTEATYTVTAGDNQVNELDLTNLPLRANYQTNVYGALLSTKATFKVEIKAGFATPSYDNAWDGTTVAMPKIENGTATIVSPAEFVGLARAIGDAKVANKDLGLKEIVLDTDIDLGGHQFLGFGRENYPNEADWDGYVSPSKYALTIAFDGQGHTIKNYTVPLRRYGRGLFNWLSAGSSVKNLVVEGVQIGDESTCSGNISGIVAGYTNGCTFENITVRNCTIYGYGKNGAIAGCAPSNGTTKFINCVVENVTINARYENGGILGILQGSHVVSFENCPEPDVNYIQYRDDWNFDADGNPKNGLFMYNGAIQHYAVESAGVPDLTKPMPKTLSNVNAEMFWENNWVYCTYGKYYSYQSAEAISEKVSLYTLTYNGILYLVGDTPVDAPVMWDTLIINNPDYQASEPSN